MTRRGPWGRDALQCCSALQRHIAAVALSSSTVPCCSAVQCGTALRCCRPLLVIDWHGVHMQQCTPWCCACCCTCALSVHAAAIAFHQCVAPARLLRCLPAVGLCIDVMHALWCTLVVHGCAVPCIAAVHTAPLLCHASVHAGAAAVMCSALQHITVALQASHCKALQGIARGAPRCCRALCQCGLLRHLLGGVAPGWGSSSQAALLLRRGGAVLAGPTMLNCCITAAWSQGRCIAAAVHCGIAMWCSTVQHGALPCIAAVQAAGSGAACQHGLQGKIGVVHTAPLLS